jgi:hypothetical protein
VPFFQSTRLAIRWNFGLISEEMWIEAAAAAVKDMGAEKFLRLLLENLKENYVAS